MELVGGLGVAHLHAHVSVAVDGGQHGLQSGILIESAHELTVDLELTQKLALVIHPVIRLATVFRFHSVALGVDVIVNVAAAFLVHRLDIALCLHLVEGVPNIRFITQQLAQGLGGIHIGGRLIQAQRLGGVAGDGEGGALLRGELQGEALFIGSVALFQLDLVAESLVDLGLEVRYIVFVVLVLRQLDLLSHAVKGQRKLLAGEVVAQSGVLVAERLTGGFQRPAIDIQILLELAGGTADGHAVAGTALFGKLDVSLAVHLHVDLFADLYGGAVAEGHGLLAQLASDGLGQLIGILINIQLAEIDGKGAVAAVFDGQGAGDVAQLLLLGQIHRAAGKFRLVRRFAAADAGDGVGGRPRQLLDTEDLHIAAGLAAGADHIGVFARGGDLHGLIEKAAGEQVRGGCVGGIFVRKGRHFADDAAVDLLLPLHLGALLLKRGDLGLVAGYRVFDHGLGVHAAGKTADHIPIAVNAAGAASHTADRCHN